MTFAPHILGDCFWFPLRSFQFLQPAVSCMGSLHTSAANRSWILVSAKWLFYVPVPTSRPKNNHNTKQLTRCLCLDSPWQPTLPFSACASQGFHCCGLLFYQASPELSQTMRGEWGLEEDPLWAQHGANTFLFESQKRNQTQRVHRVGPAWGLLIKGKSEWFGPLGAAALL